jgi:single-strand DNA-binding protein|tara:strand:+ start:3568 stop:3933 length:366 start_codon:yes stop_codon:yes gene_type:complete
MATLNSTHMMGNLTRDPETIEKDGFSITSFSIAINEQKKEGDSWVDDPTFQEAKAFGKNAEFIQKHFEKGKQIWFRGKTRTEKWVDKQSGDNRSKNIIHVESCGFCGSKADSAPKADTGGF